MLVLIFRPEFSGDRLMIGYADRIHALYNAYYLFWNGDNLFLNHFVIFDYIDFGIGSYKRNFINLAWLEISVGNLDDSFLSKKLAFQIHSKSYLVGAILVQTQNADYFKKLICRYVVQYCSVLYCANL